MRHYLIVPNSNAEFEDLKISKVTELNKGDYHATCSGWVNIIDITNPEFPQLLLFTDEDTHSWVDI